MWLLTDEHVLFAQDTDPLQSWICFFSWCKYVCRLMVVIEWRLTVWVSSLYWHECWKKTRNLFKTGMLFWMAFRIAMWMSIENEKYRQTYISELPKAPSILLCDSLRLESTFSIWYFLPTHQHRKSFSRFLEEAAATPKVSNTNHHQRTSS